MTQANHHRESNGSARDHGPKSCDVARWPANCPEWFTGDLLWAWPRVRDRDELAKAADSVFLRRHWPLRGRAGVV